MREYRTVSTHTLAGLREAEKLHLSGWKTERVGLFTTRFYRDKARPEGKPGAESARG